MVYVMKTKQCERTTNVFIVQCFPFAIVAEIIFQLFYLKYDISFHRKLSTATALMIYLFIFFTILGKCKKCAKKSIN